MVIYLLGERGGQLGGMRGCAILLGKYSLLGYIAQIAILQLLHRGLWHIDLGITALFATFALACLLTILTVAANDRARARVGAVDKLYKAVFA